MPGVGRQDAELVAALRRGDERAFAELVDEWGPAMLRLAQLQVGSRAVAEEVVQEAWLAVLRGLDGFEGRSAFRTWVFGIVVNVARARGRRERRTLPFSFLRRRAEEGRPGPVVDPDRFLPAGHPERPGWWALPPAPWAAPDERLVADEMRDVILSTIAELPVRQRAVIVLRDVEGCPAEEACEALGLSEGNQRVLLHRARARVRNAVERQFGAEVAL